MSILRAPGDALLAPQRFGRGPRVTRGFPRRATPLTIHSSEVTFESELVVVGGKTTTNNQENSRPGNSDGATHVQIYNNPATHCDAAMIHIATWPADGAAALPAFSSEPQFVRTCA